MHNVRKALGDKVVLDNITLVLLSRRQDRRRSDLNGTGQVDAAQLMAGIEKPNNGDAMLA